MIGNVLRRCVDLSKGTNEPKNNAKCFKLVGFVHQKSSSDFFHTYLAH